MKRCTLVEFQRDQTGAAYTLSYVMILPLIILLCCLVCETCLILVAKMGTVYASFAATRTAIVRYSAQEQSAAEQQIAQAAIQAFAPFASGLAKVQGSSTDTSEALEQSYVGAYRRTFPDASVSDSYLRAKVRYASSAISIEPTGPPANWDDDVSVTVTYRYPYSFELIGRLFGAERDGNQFIRRIASTSTLQSESPKNEEQALGITYASP